MYDKNRYLHDRRFKKPEDLHPHPVKVRITDAELDELQEKADRYTDGKLAVYMRECVLLGHRIREEQKSRVTLQMALGKDPAAGIEDQEAMATALRDLLRESINRQSGKAA